MGSYFKYFKIPIIITVVISIICLALFIKGSNSVDTYRYNNEYDNSVCVYDYANKMTDEEVSYLNEYLRNIEAYNCVDIAYLILDDAEYGYLDAVQMYAQDFAINNNMGFNGPGGDTIVFIDNWSRGGDGRIHSWIATRGDRINSDLSNSRCEDILMVLDEIPDDYADPYEQYMRIAQYIGYATKTYKPPFSMLVCFIVSLVLAGIYVIINLKSKVADITVNNSTYLNGGRATFPVRRDIFLHKTVTKRKIERSSSSGGSSGGGGGGGSFGGGGHSR